MSDSSNLHQQAITAALSGNWEKAITLNTQILKAEPGNVDGLNRLGRSYFETGKYTQAKKCFNDTLKQDPYNQIASKFLKRIKTFDKKGLKQPHICPESYPIAEHGSDLFIEEPGKTKVATLIKVAEPQKLSLLSAGAHVNLVIKNHGVTVADQNGEYLGILPDDLSHRLVRLIHGGNKYQACIKNTKPNSLSILIREMYRCPRFKNQASFLDGLNVSLAYSSDHIVLRDDNEEELSEEEMNENEDIT